MKLDLKWIAFAAVGVILALGLAPALAPKRTLKERAAAACKSYQTEQARADCNLAYVLKEMHDLKLVYP